LLLEQGRAGEVVAVVLPAVEANPDDVQLQRMLALGFLGDGRYDDFIGLADGLRDRVGDDRGAEFDRGVAQLKAGDQEVGAETIARAIAVSVQDLAAVDPFEPGAAAPPDRSGVDPVTATAVPEQPVQPDLPPGPTVSPDGTDLDLVTAASTPEPLQPALQPGPEAQASAEPAATQAPPSASDQAAAEPPGAESAPGSVPDEPIGHEDQQVASLDATPEMAPPAAADLVQPAEQDQVSAASPPEDATPQIVQPVSADDSNATIETAGAVSADDRRAEVAASAQPQSAMEAQTSAVPDVEAFVRDWAAAWSRQDVEGYLARYAASFRPAHGASREAWEKQRRERVLRPRSISVEISALEVVPLDQQHVKVTFVQAYRADHYRDQVSKALWLMLAGGDWKILREVSL